MNLTLSTSARLSYLSKVSIEIQRESPTDHWLVRTIRLRFSNINHRVHFDDPTTLEQAFREEICEALAPFLARIDQASVLSAKDFSLDIAGLAIKGLRVITQGAHDGVHFVYIHFVEAVGLLTNLFNKEFNQFEQKFEDRLNLATSTLVDLVTPCIELFEHILEKGLSQEQAELVRPRLRTMKTKSVQLREYAEELSREISRICYQELCDGVTASRDPPDQIFEEDENLIDLNVEPARDTFERNKHVNVIFGHQKKLDEPK